MEIRDPYHDVRKKPSALRESLGIDDNTLLIALEPQQLEMLAKFIVREMIAEREGE